MNRQQKVDVVSELREKFNASKASVLVKYQGLTVTQIQDLRKKLRSSDASLKVAKARLMKIAANESNVIPDFTSNFKNQVCLVFVKNEMPSVAKQIVEFAKVNEGFKIIAGYEDSKLLTESQIKFLASLPSREVLLAQLVGTLQAPMSMLARLLQAVLEQKQGSSSTDVEVSSNSNSGGGE